MTVPPGPVIPVPLLPSRRTDAGIRRRPARCFPFRAADVRGRRPSGQRDKRIRSRARRPEVPFGRMDRTRPRPPHLRRRAPHRNVHAAVGRGEPRVLRQVPLRVRSAAARRHRRRRARRSCPTAIDALAGLELGGVPLATMISQVTRPARRLRPQGGQDLRHLPARRGRRGRRPAPVHHRRRRHLRRRDPRRRRRSCGPGARSSGRSSV